MDRKKGGDRGGLWGGFGGDLERDLGGIWGGDDALRLENLLYLSIFYHKSLHFMDFGQVIEAILVLLAIREMREYRKERKSNDNSRKDADNGKINRSSR